MNTSIGQLSPLSKMNISQNLRKKSTTSFPFPIIEEPDSSDKQHIDGNRMKFSSSSKHGKDSFHPYLLHKESSSTSTSSNGGQNVEERMKQSLEAKKVNKSSMMTQNVSSSFLPIKDYSRSPTHLMNSLSKNCVVLLFIL